MVALAMATLRFNFGTMGSGKSTMALQIHHNLASRQLYGLLLTKLDREGAQVTSRLGVAAEAVEVVPELDLFKLAVDHWPIHYMVCDEVQFYTAQQCDQLGRAVDELGVDVFAFGLITDFRGELFDGTKRMLEIADERVPMQVEARCWCGARATHNARVVNGEVVYEGDTVVVGDTEHRRRPAAVRRRGALRVAVPPALPTGRTRHLGVLVDHPGKPAHVGLACREAAGAFGHLLAQPWHRRCHPGAWAQRGPDSAMSDDVVELQLRRSVAMNSSLPSGSILWR